MDLWVTLGVLIKRWYITLPLLALVGVAAIQIGNGIEPTYSATATGRVYCPDQQRNQITGEIETANRFCADGTTDDLAAVGAVNLDSRLTRIDVRDQGLPSDYVVDSTDASLSLIYVTAESENEDDVIAALELTMAIFENYVDAEQADEVFKYTAGGIDIPIQADSISSSKTRTQIIVLVAGLILTTVLVHIFDAAIGAWKKRSDATAAEAEQAAAAEAEPEPDDESPLDAARADDTDDVTDEDVTDEDDTDEDDTDDDAADDDDQDWEEAKKLFDSEVEKLTSESSSRWGR